MDEIAKAILGWHENVIRDLPWKNTVDPYFIWVSEIILQQTRVEQGKPYYIKFINRFPSIKELAEATQEEVYKVWEGLGYYSRARNMHASAKHIHFELKGVFPSTYEEIIKLKGIGPYTAAAISSFAFNEDRAVLDGNVFRVLARLYNEDAFINEGKNRKLFQGLVDNLLPPGNAAIFNQAIMDFGALFCKPSNPNCKSCVVNEMCEAYRQDNVSKLPQKKKAQKKRSRYFYFLDLSLNATEFPVVKRESKDIWQGLFSLPFVESSTELPIMKQSEWEDSLGFSLGGLPQKTWETKHVLSHQLLHCRFFRISGGNTFNESSSPYGKSQVKWINNPKEVPFPVVILKYFDHLKLT